MNEVVTRRWMIPKQRLLILMGAAAFHLLLNWSYVHITSPIYDYYGFVYRGPRPIAVGISTFLLSIVPALWLPVHLKRPSSLILWLLYLMVYVPSTIVPFYALDVPSTDLLVYVSALLASHAALSMTHRLRYLEIRPIAVPKLLFWSAIAAFSGLLYGYMYLVFDFSLQIGSLIDVYDTRFAYRDSVEQAGGPLGYAVTWQAKVLNPLMMGYGLVKRRISLVALGVMGQIIIFSFTGLKGVIFSGLFLTALLIVAARNGRYFGVAMMTGAISLVLVTAVLYVAFGLEVPSKLIVNRVFLLPGLLTGQYFEFFSSHEQAHLGHSILSSFVEYPYSLEPPRLIGSIYFRDAAINANANAWADGFANFGFLGIAIVTLALGAFIWIFDSLARRHDLRLALLLIGGHAFTLANTALLTTLLTHGMLLTLVIMYVVQTEEVVAHRGQELGGARRQLRYASS